MSNDQVLATLIDLLSTSVSGEARFFIQSAVNSLDGSLDKDYEEDPLEAIENEDAALREILEIVEKPQRLPTPTNPQRLIYPGPDQQFWLMGFDIT